MRYKVLRTAAFERQLSDIIRYIAVSAGNVDTALRYLGKIEKSVVQLEDFPYIGTKPRYSVLQRKGYRVLTVGKHLIFYKVDEEKRIVVLYTIVDGRREYRRLI